jgi:hypothetical protein
MGKVNQGNNYFLYYEIFFILYDKLIILDFLTSLKHVNNWVNQYYLLMKSMQLLNKEVKEFMKHPEEFYQHY